ncbi:MAG: DNA-binding response regulator [Chitinophagaceae bacterium]|nr:response regulator transcription factor [Chitinophagaceae bacterium]MCZ2299842.1 response regulator transcription factor [Chitinophagales bacterium]
MIRVVVVDDKKINRKTIETNLLNTDEISIVWEAENGKDFLQKMQQLLPVNYPDIVLMDIDMPVMNGIEAITVGTIKYEGVKFIVLTVFDDDEKIFEAIQAGACGYLLKDDNALQLKEAITGVIEHNSVPMSPAIARKTLSWLKYNTKPVAKQNEANQVLSERELEILKQIVSGKDYKAIAVQLFISPKTVRAHIYNIYQKLHINSKAEATAIAYKMKWI